MIKWEYKVIPMKTRVHSDHFQSDGKPIIDDVQNDLNALGHEGWELVSIQDINLPDGRMFTVAYLKRRFTVVYLKRRKKRPRKKG